MIRINLGKGAFEEKGNKRLAGLNLPPQVVARLQKLTSDIGVLVTIVVGVAIAFLFPLVGKQARQQMITEHEGRMREINDKITAATNEIGKFTHYKAELESYNNQKTLVTNRLGAVRQLLDSRGTPVNVLDTVGQSLPGRTWLGGVDLSLNGEGALSLAGTSYSNEEVSDLVEKLSESIYLSDVSLDEVGSRNEGQVELKTFIITAKPKLKLAAGPGGGPAPASLPPAK